MRFKFWSIALAVLIGVPVASCNDAVITAPLSPLTPGSARMTVVAQSPKAGLVVISQVFGGNGGATTSASDYVEIFNRSAGPVDINGWSVQYASSTGTGSFGGNGVSTLATVPTVLASGQYYLVKLRTSTTGPAIQADVTGANTDVSGTNGKVVLLDNNTALGCNGANLVCSAADLSHIVDLVGYGNANFFETAAAPAATSSTAVFRKNGGLTDTDNNSLDFTTTDPPAPRNSHSPLNPPSGNTVSATLTPGSSTVPVGTPMAYTVTAANGGSPVAISAVTWESTNTAVAPNPTVTSTPPDQTHASTTAATKGTTSIKATVTTAFGTATATVNLTVVGVPATVTVNPPTFSLTINGTTTFSATALDSDGQPAPTNITWSSLDPNIATIDPQSGLATAKNPGTVTIRATTNNNITGDASLTVLPSDNGPIVPTTVFVSELHYDNISTDANEAVEIETPAGMSLSGWKLNLYDGSTGALYANTSGLTPPVWDLGGLTPTICGNRQVVVVNLPVNGLQNGGQDNTLPLIPDGWAITDAQGHAVEFGSYEGTFVAVSGPAAGFRSTDIGVMEIGANTSATQSLQRAMNGVWFGPKANTFGACNPATPPAPELLIIQDRPTPLPKGFQDEFFIDATKSKDTHGNVVSSGDVNWTSANTNVATIDAHGIITAKAVGTSLITATAKNDAGAVGTTLITVNDPSVSANARTGHNTELGIPTDADGSDDVIITHRQYTLSYNKNHGGPNWVSWNLDATHKGGSARCDCFTADPDVAAIPGATAYNTFDWINGGVYSRGHMSPSADWNISDGDNAPTFYLSNMLPQNQALNAGAWGDLENKLRAMATGSTEIYIIAGPIFTNGVGLGFINSATPGAKILAPDSIFKIAIIVPDGRPASGIPANVQVIATKFPNVNNTQTAKQDYTPFANVTINDIQKSTGYDFLSAIPPDIQCKIEVRDCDPTARISGDVDGITASGVEGQTLHFDASTSTDPDNDPLQYQWSVNGVVAGIGATLDYTFPNNGAYEVKAVVGDGKGGFGLATITANITNVAPVVAAFSGGTVNKGSPFSSSGSFTDPGADTWTATVNYGDQSGPQPLALSGKTFSLNHTYSVAGTFTVTVTINDGDASVSQTASVTVVNRPPVAAITGAGLAGGAEAQTLTFSGATSSDPDNGDIISYQWTVNGQIAGTTATLNYTFPDNGNYTVGLLVSDLSGATDSKSAMVNVTNTAPTVTLGATTPISIISGGSVSVAGSFTDLGPDSPWQTSIVWGNGATTNGTQTATGASITGTQTFLAAGTYNVVLKVTDKDGGVGASLPVTVVVGRVAVTGDVNPSSIKLNDTGNGEITFRLYGNDAVDITTLDVASVKIGTVSPEKSGFDQSGRASLQFSRKALIAAGALTAESTELVLTANLKDGRQIVSKVSVDVH